MKQKLIEWLVGKVVIVETDVNVDVPLGISQVEPIMSDRVVQGTQEFGWRDETYQYISKYKIHFTNGATKYYDRLDDLMFETEN